MNRFSTVFCLLSSVLVTSCLLNNSCAFAQDARSIIERSFNECRKLKGGTYKMTISKKTFNDKTPVTLEADCQFLKTSNDTLVPWKFSIRLSNGDGALCTANDYVQLKAEDSTGTIYSKNNNQGDFGSAPQSEGLFPPFFLSQITFNIDHLGETTMISRKDNDETVGGKLCFKIHLIDLLRYSSATPQKVEKIFLVDKQTWLPVEYSETSTLRVGIDSLVKNYSYKITEMNTSIPPHDSVFTFKRIPDFFQLRTLRGAVYHHHLKTGMTAPSFRGKIVGADSLFSQSAYGGKSVLLYFFSRSSYPSLKALSTLQHYQDSNKNIEVLIVGVDVGERNLSEILKQRNITLKAIANAESIANNYFITSTPTFVIIDGKGIIQKIEAGFGERTKENLKY